MTAIILYYIASYTNKRIIWAYFYFSNFVSRVKIAGNQSGV